MPIVQRKLYRESRKHVTLFLSSFLDEKSSDENGGIRRRVKQVFKCAFSRGKAGGVHVKIQKGMLVQFCVFEIWTHPFCGRGGWVSKTGSIF